MSMFELKNPMVTRVCFVALLLSMAMGSVAYAQNEGAVEVVVEEQEIEVIVEEISSEAVGEDGLTEAERQALLQELARQVEELERKVNELSLLVSKVVLERQALALQEQLEREMAGLTQGAPPPASSAEESAATEAGIAKEPVQNPESIAASPPQSGKASQPTSQDDILSGMGITASPTPENGSEATGESVSEEREGFLAALQAFGRNLGIPELVTIAILAFLAVLILLRRVTGGKRVAMPGTKGRPSQQPNVVNTPPMPSSEQPQISQTNPPQDSRQELKERISWQ